jgi:hypothetical protein
VKRDEERVLDVLVRRRPFGQRLKRSRTGHSEQLEIVFGKRSPNVAQPGVAAADRFPVFELQAIDPRVRQQ